jgi:hypothetical protein
MHTFFSEDYVGISIEFRAPQETNPGENITISLWINSTAANMKIESLTISIYGFRYGKEKISLRFVDIIGNTFPLAFNHTEQYNYTVSIPTEVWDATYAELHIEYTVANTLFKDDRNFPITTVRNVYLEQLEIAFKNLNQTYWQLNQTFSECFQMNLTKENLNSLNQTYLELQQNYTSVQGNLIELGNIRTAVIILAITTIFFIATTFYVVMRKPKQYW